MKVRKLFFLVASSVFALNVGFAADDAKIDLEIAKFGFEATPCEGFETYVAAQNWREYKAESRECGVCLNLNKNGQRQLSIYYTPKKFENNSWIKGAYLTIVLTRNKGDFSLDMSLSKGSKKIDKFSAVTDVERLIPAGQVSDSVKKMIGFGLSLKADEGMQRHLSGQDAIDRSRIFLSSKPFPEKWNQAIEIILADMGAN